ncbi:MAG: hypothetical protein H6617_06290 [Bdellovibrionaceae bacterium]|nr:hypothetical protein [Pseudobdellovibrionaceae bacterium]
MKTLKALSSLKDKLGRVFSTTKKSPASGRDIMDEAFKELAREFGGSNNVLEVTAGLKENFISVAAY